MYVQIAGFFVVVMLALVLSLPLVVQAGADVFVAGGLEVRIDSSVITFMKDASGKVYADASTTPSIGKLNMIDKTLVPKDPSVYDTNGPWKINYNYFTSEVDAELTMTLDYHQESGDIIIMQKGEAEPGLYGVQWGIAGIPLEYNIIIPGYGGIKLDKNMTQGSYTFEYPGHWEAQFVIIQGERGGFWVRADDIIGRYKTLTVWRNSDGWDLAFETRNNAPFSDKDSIESVSWRLRNYEGDWQVPASKYRSWAESSFDLTQLSEQDPDWVNDIRLVVTMNYDYHATTILEPLSKQVDPTQTLIYIPHWRRDRYDVNYPDYTPQTGLASFVWRAQNYGFRVMLHVNYFGCDPNHELYQDLAKYQARDEFTDELRWWIHGDTKIAYINPASQLWREIFVERMAALVDRVNPDAIMLDQTLLMWNDGNGLIDGKTMIQGNIALHQELRAALPNIALSGEGLNEITFRMQSFAQRHIRGIDFLHGIVRDPRWFRASHPIASFIFRPYTTMYGYLGMVSPTFEEAYPAWWQTYIHWGVIPTLMYPEEDLITDDKTGYVRQLFDEIIFFQEMRLEPDLDGTWADNTVFPYKTAENERAEYIKESDGFALIYGDETISRTITGVSSVQRQGHIPGWRNYDDEGPVGLDPNLWYPFFEEDPKDYRRYIAYGGLILAFLVGAGFIVYRKVF